LISISENRGISFVQSTFSTNNEKEISSNTPADQSDENNVVTYTAIPTKQYSKDEAQSIISNTLYPPSEYKKRMYLGYQYTGVEDDHNQKALTNDDERLRYTYAEFPVESFHHLVVERAFYWKSTLEKVQKSAMETFEEMETEEKCLVDIGSGCAQLVLYGSLILNGNGCHESNNSKDKKEKSNWSVHGIEISQSTHDHGIKMLERGMQENFFHPASIDSQNQDEKLSKVSLHLGSAASCISLLSKADVIFSYSSVFNTVGFSTTVGGMILAPEWSDMLAQQCKNGCIVVTTDRALDPTFGWTLLEKLDVENPDLIGSTGFIQILDKELYQSSVENCEENLQGNF